MPHTLAARRLAGDAAMPLTDTAIPAVKPADRAVKHTDSGGLYLLRQPTGGKQL